MSIAALRGRHRRGAGWPAAPRPRLLSIVTALSVAVSLQIAPVLSAIPAAQGAPAKSGGLQPAKVTRLDSATGAAQLKEAEGRWDAQAAASRAIIAADVRAAKAPKKQSRAGGTTSTKLSPLATTAGTASGSDGTGTYTATPLSPSSSWTSGGSSGSFDWSYPFTTTAPAAGPAPQLAIDYDSGSVDGRTAVTNNQTSVVGEGFELTQSYIERSYLDCDQDGMTGKHDLCWHGEQLTLVLDGQSNPMVPTGANTFRLARDDGSIIKRLTGAANGDNDGEYWQLTTSDGTTYTFGINHLPGWASGDPTTNSTWTVPVYGNNADPAEAQTCADNANWCEQAWRWNLDMVEDLHNNAETYWYTAESNRYARAGSTGTDYERGGFLREIDYGLRSGNLFNNAGSSTDKTTAPYQVSLGYSERCIDTAANPCPDSLTSDTKSQWPDVPFSSICDSGDCGDNSAPTFFTRKRLTSVTTQIETDSGGYRAIDRWDLEHSWYDPGDLNGPFDHVLWLDAIQHTGYSPDGSSAQTAPVKLVYSGNPMENRVDKTGDGKPPLIRPRLEQIINEVGGITIVDYTSVQCDPNNLPATTAQIAANTQRCFPVYWISSGDTPTIDWFNKYVVDSVTDEDTTTGDAVTTTYRYVGDAGWKYDDDPQLPNKYRTWSDWRGYSEADTLVGRTDEERSLTANYYLRGMDGNRDASGTKTTAHVSGLDAPGVTDSDQFAGMTYETVLYDGEAPDGTKGAKLSETINTPWSSDATASTTLPGGRIGGADADPVPLNAYMVSTQTTVDRTFISGSLFTSAASRSTTTHTDFDGDGMPQQTNSYATPDDAAPGSRTDSTCTSYTYARNRSINLLTPIARILVQSVPCANASSAALPNDASTPGSVISDTLIEYDAATTWDSQAPTRGDPTTVNRSVGYTASGDPKLQPDPAATMTYDALGRVRTSTDADGAVTKTDYQPSGAGVPESTTTTNALGQATTTTWDPARMLALSTVDPNGKTVEQTYDSLGRLTAVWNASVSRAQGQPAIEKFSYHLGGQTNSDRSVTGSWIDTQTPKGGSLTGYNDSYQIFDALYRPRQTQTPSIAGGQILTDTEFDDRGNVATNITDAWDDADAPDGTRWVVANGGSNQTDNTYDGADRLTRAVESWTVPTAGTCVANSTRCSRTSTTTYTGDSTISVPPSGGTASATVTDALGRTVEAVKFPGRDVSTLSGSIKSVSAYDDQGRLQSVTGNDGLATTYSYDLLGRMVSSSDPASGTTKTSYDDVDQVTSTTDARQSTLSYTYDLLGRKTGTFSGSDTTNKAAQLASWTYDAAGQLGQLSSSTRYVGGKDQSGTLAYTKTINKYDSLYRPLSTTVSLPNGDPLVSDAKLPANYTATTAYNRDGSTDTITDPAVAGLPAETESYGYDSTGLGYQTSLDGAQGIVLNTGYTPLGDLDDLNLGISGTNSDQVSFDYTYDSLRRLINFKTTDSASTGPHLINAAYGYNNADRVTHVWDTAGSGNSENQCYAYGDFGRLATEWTPSTSNCAASTQAAGSIGGAAPYWKSFVYAGNGRRTSRVDHAFGATTADKTWTYTYGATCSGVDQSSRILTGVRLVTGSTTTANSSYCVNAVGDQTTSATSNGTSRTATWDSENHLASVATGTTKYDYLYDADGSVLIKRPDGNAAGTTTLYLGDTEVQATKSSTGTWTLKGLRYYTDEAAGTVAVRSGTPGQTSALSYLAADPQGTTTAEWSATAPGTSRAKRYTDAYGAPISSPAWPDNKRFLGKTWDGTMGLSALGARQYDPQTGRFISVDPLLAASDPGSLDEYSYSDDDPTNEEDPSGEFGGGMVMMCDDRPCSVATGQDGSSAQSNAPASTSSSVSEAGTNYVTRHNDAVAVAIAAVQAQVAARGGNPANVLPNLKIKAARKRPKGRGFGIADITYNDGSTIYVWEVKAIGQGAAKAKREAEWYVSRLKADHKTAAVGWAIGGPYPGLNGDWVSGPRDGAVVYQDGLPPRLRQPSTQPTAVPQVAPQPTPAPNASRKPALPQPVGPPPSPLPTPGALPGPVSPGGGGLIPDLMRLTAIVGSALLGTAMYFGGAASCVVGSPECA